MDYCKNKVSKINIGYYIFENKKDPKLFKTINNKFNLLVKKYHKKDASFGLNIYLDYEGPWCEKQNKYDYTNIKLYISNILDNIIPEYFINHIAYITNNENNYVEKYLYKYNYLKSIIVNSDGSYNHKTIYSIILHNIHMAKIILKNYNIPIAEIYEDKIQINLDQLIQMYFPNISKRDIKKIKLIKTYNYIDNIDSIINYIVKKIKLHFKLNIIYDIFANFGLYSVKFSKYFTVYANETEYYDILVNNIKYYSNITVLNLPIDNIFDINTIFGINNYITFINLIDSNIDITESIITIMNKKQNNNFVILINNNNIDEAKIIKSFNNIKYYEYNILNTYKCIIFN